MEVFNVLATMSLVDMITAPLRRISGQMGTTGQAASSLSSRALGLAKSLAPVALAAGVFFASLAPCVGTAADFESAMAGVGAVSRATPEDMRRLSDAARELGSTTAWSAMQVAEGQKYLAMAGFSVQENIAGLPAVLNMASAGATDLGRAADISSDILSAFNMQAAQMPRVADTLTAAFTSSNTSLELLGETMKYVAPVAEKAGVSLEQTAAMAGLLGNVGIKGSQAGTALRAMLNGLAAPSSEAAKAMAALGVQTQDAAGNLRSPITILAEMAEAMDGLGSAQKMAAAKTVFGTEAMSSVLALFDQAGAGGITEYAKQLEAAGTAAEIAARQNDTLRGDQKALGSAFESLQITIGSVFLPALRGITQAATAVVRGLDALAGHPVGKFLLGLVSIAGAVVLAVSGMSLVVWAATTAWAALNAVILANPVGLVIGAIVALVAGIVALYNNCEPVREVLDAVWQAMTRLWSGVVDFFSILTGVGVVGVFAYYFTDAYNAVTRFWDGLKNLFNIDLAESGRKLIQTFVGGIKSVVTAPYEAVKAGLNKLRQLLPFSDAKEGPLSSLTLSGTRMLETIGAGIKAAAPQLHAAAVSALSGVGVAANMAVTPPDLPAPEPPATLAARTESGPAPTAPGRNITIHGLTVHLSGVQDADGLLSELERLVAQHDGSADWGGQT
jgi:TP901 family phage tail tape measure protein